MSQLKCLKDSAFRVRFQEESIVNTKKKHLAKNKNKNNNANWLLSIHTPVDHNNQSGSITLPNNK